MLITKRYLGFRLLGKAVPSPFNPRSVWRSLFAKWDIQVNLSSFPLCFPRVTRSYLENPDNDYAEFELERRIALAKEEGSNVSGKKPMSQKEFDGLIGRHESWLADNNAGRQLVIRDRDLFGLNAKGRNLSEAEFTDCSMWDQ